MVRLVSNCSELEVQAFRVSSETMRCEACTYGNGD